MACVQPWAYGTQADTEFALLLEMIVLCSEATQLLSFLTVLCIFLVFFTHEFSNSPFISLTIPTHVY